MSKWIEFQKQYGIPEKKTDTYLILTKDSGNCIGIIKWYAAWRKYSFFPNPNCVFETQCMRDIISFIDGLMLQRKLQKQGQSY